MIAMAIAALLLAAEPAQEVIEDFVTQESEVLLEDNVVVNEELEEMIVLEELSDETVVEDEI